MPDQLRDQLQTALGSAYTLGRELGGGMSRVFVAEETALGRQVVVKVLPPETVGGVSAIRFRREIAVAARLQHPHIVPLLSTGEMDGVPFFTMPFVEGESLRVGLARRGELPVAEAVRLLREIASALAYAHEHGVVHRDIKPDNVLLSGGVAMVTDFGVAKALSASASTEHGGTTSVGVALGTPAYMAPEQASADPALDHRADVYAFGTLAYEVLTGQPPFVGRSPQALLAAHIAEVPEPLQRRRPSIPPALNELVMCCLEKRPADRPQSAAELVHALDALATPSGGTSAARARPGAPHLAPARRRLGPAVAAVAVLLTAAAGAAVALRVGSGDANGGANGGAAAATSVTGTSLAVLPLANIGGDTANEYFAQGMADELTGALARVPGLRVASRTTAAGVLRRHPDADARAVGRELGVGAVLEGTVRRAPGRLRLTAQLTSVGDGLVLWAETYEREVQDVFAVQDDIARSIVAALRLRLAGGRDSGITVAGTRDLEAHELYLRARHLWARRTRLDEAVALLRQAIARDPSYAQAYAALASVYAILPDWSAAAADTTAPRAIEYARRALALDGSLGEAHAALGNAYAEDHDRLDDAERAYRAAIAVEPGNASAHHWYGLLLALRGRVDEALGELRRAHEVDPLAPNIHSQYALALAVTGQLAEAERQLRTLVATEPAFGAGYFHLAGVLLAQGRVDAAQAYADSGMRGGSPAAGVAQLWPLGVVGAIQARSGREAEARRTLARVRALGARDERGWLSHAEALIFVAFDQPDSALAALRRDVERGHIAMLQFTDLTPFFAPLRGDPRYAALFQRAGIRP